MITIIGFAPAGGCTTFSNIIKAILKPTANGISKYIGRGTVYKKIIPIIEVNRCPKKTFFGWENVLSGYPKSKTIEDPKDVIKKIPNSVLYVSKVSNESVTAENNPAEIDFVISIFFIFNYDFNAFVRALKGNNKHSFLAIFFLLNIMLKIDHSLGKTLFSLSKNVSATFNKFFTCKIVLFTEFLDNKLTDAWQ